MRTFLLKPTALFLIAAGAHQLSAKNKHKPAPVPGQNDQISVDGHIALSGSPILRFVATQHYDRSYIYAERAVGQPVTVLDVTQPARPAIVSQLDAGTNLLAVAGTAVLLSSGSPETAPHSVQTIRVMDLSDPANPKVTRQFEDVTAVEKVGNLILLANAEGVWVLSQHLANDPKVDERYARKVIYGESMF